MYMCLAFGSLVFGPYGVERRSLRGFVFDYEYASCKVCYAVLCFVDAGAEDLKI